MSPENYYMHLNYTEIRNIFPVSDIFVYIFRRFITMAMKARYFNPLSRRSAYLSLLTNGFSPSPILRPLIIEQNEYLRDISYRNARKGPVGP
jgi:hypothetical protein